MAESIYDQFKVVSKRMINNDDIYSLSRIYLPLMGIDSYALYFGLSCLECDKEYHFKTVLDIMNLKGIKAFNTASNKLEGLGLLNVYEKSNKDGKDYLFELKRPLSIIEALNEETLMDLLASQIGKTEVDRLIAENDINVKSYKNITKKMDDVFETDTGEKYEFLKKLIPDNKVHIENKKFNYPLFKYSFDSNFITEEVLEEEEFKENILHISFVYKLSELDMKDVVFNALSIEKNLDYASLSKHAKIKFSEVYKTDDVRLITIEEDSYLESIKDDEVLKICTQMEAYTPADILTELNNGFKATTSELSMVDKLIKNTKMPIPVINFLIYYVCKSKNGEIPGYDYFEKIANTWRRAKIKNVADAINYTKNKLREIEDKKNAPRYATNKKVIKPEWYDKYQEELNKKLEDNKELNSDETKKILEEAEGIFGGNNEQ